MDRHAAAATSPSPFGGLAVRDLMAVPATVENFAPFGQFVEPVHDGAPFGPRDAQLDLSAGTPRFYLMDLPAPGAVFGHITRHRRTTQCLGSSCGSPWLIAVAPPTGEGQAEPDLEAIKGFVVPGHSFIMLWKGTWHAGPFFSAPDRIRFFNLELSDTNQVDHQSSMLRERFGLLLRLTPGAPET
jgi:ureidoglycolate hydrolase